MSVHPTRIALLLALLAPAAQAADTKGYLYGTVTTRAGKTYEGRLRWGTEEAFWTDHFNGNKAERPLTHDVPREHRHAREEIKVFGIDVGFRFRSDDEGRQLVVRFGDLKSILVEGGDEATLVMKGGEEVSVDGGSNDIGARISVWDRTLGEVQLDWSKIKRIDFKATPDLGSVPGRLHGTVKTISETLRGYVQWDKEECLATDQLNGETDDGKLAVEMGKIKSIERRDSRSSSVTLKDGRELVMSGTNDVNSENRGIFVDDPRYGRVLVSWKSFERVDFDDAGSGPGYDEFAAAGPLRGTVKTAAGATLKGRLVYDVDETYGWETLDGQQGGLAYSIPFEMVATVVPAGHRTKVVLRGSGTEELRLKDTTDVSERNAGVFVFEGDKKTYVAWEDVRRIDFDK